MRKVSLKKAFPLIFFIIFILYAITVIVPIIWVLFTSLKSKIEFILNPLGIPQEWKFSNYPEAFRELYVQISDASGFRKVFMWELFFNTLVYAIGSTLVSVFTRCVSAYVVARYNFRFKQLLYSIVIITMILPIIGSTPSALQVMRIFGFYDSLPAIIFMSGGFTGMSFLIFYATFKGISWEYAEAAFIDGASHMKVMLSIMIPLAKVTFMIMFLTGFIGDWNDYTTPLIYMPNTPTIAYGLFTFQFSNVNAVSGVPYLMAACMLVFMPIFVLFMLFKNQLIGNLTMGGLKG